MQHISDYERIDAERQARFGDVWQEFLPKVFADVPAYYDKGNAVASLGLCGWWSNRVVQDIVIPKEIGDFKVLDVCTGTHDIPRRLLKMHPGLQVFAIDRSPEMVAEGQRLAKSTGLTPIQAEIGDVYKLPWADNTFDIVTLQFATRHLRVMPVFREIYRVLKPGGVFHHSDMLRPRSRLLEVPYLWFLRLSVYLTAIIFGSTQESRACVSYFAEAIKTYYSPEEMSRLLREMGFLNVRHTSFLTGILCRHIAEKPKGS
jgi:demethylmenaquinone methyltransferase/2-methoxy-6-polyprenyl-1,4-benzoquinol methylase